MRLSKVWVLGLALLSALIVAGIGYGVLNPPRPLIENAEFVLTRITPNADQDSDITIFNYRISQNARVTLMFESETGEQYFFRDQHRRSPGAYSVPFSGVVDGFQLEGESWQGTLETRLLPDGLYHWTFSALADDGESQTRNGTLEIADGDPELPIISAFDVSRTTFTPNQDGIQDRLSVNVFLEKPARLDVYLENENGVPIYLAERRGGRAPGEGGNHEYDYDGGVDQGFRPPPDGLYTLYAVAQDAVGQRMVRTMEIEIRDSGLPQAEIMPQPTGNTVCFFSAPYEERYFTDRETTGDQIDAPTEVCSDLRTLSIPQGDLLVFRVTVRNYGQTPIRTAGPFPGTVYHFDQISNSLGAYEESGAWRLGIMCGTAEISYPWRWALAPLDELTEVYDPESDSTYYYLQPGQQAEVWGAIRMTRIVAARNPQPCAAGLIHEDVRILQNQIGRREVELLPNNLGAGANRD